jgi:hypothetical protein
MSKKITAIIILFILADIAAYLYFTKKPAQVAELNSDTVPVSEETVQSGSLKDIFDSAQSSQACTFENKTPDGFVARGVVYKGNAKMRGDFSTLIDGKTTESHIIVIDDSSYIWADNGKSGIKSVFGEEDLSVISGPSPEGTESAEVDPNTSGTFECKDWSIDDSFFSLPKDVQFAENSSPMPESSCSVCDEVTGQQRIQCLKELNCG